MLENTENKNPFRTPENYFAQFNAEIMDKLPEKQSKKIVPLWKTITKWSAIAAAMIGVAVIGANYLDNNSTTPISKVSETSYSLEDDYYSFIEDEAAQSVYQDAIFTEN